MGKYSYVGIATDTYTPIEYIEGTGTQYINTGMPVPGYTVLELDCQLTDTSNQRCLAGCTSYSSSSLSYSLYMNSGQNFAVSFGNGSSNWNQFYTGDTNRHTIRLDGYHKKVFVDGVEALDLSSKSNTYIGATNLFLFVGHNGTGNSSFIAKMKLYGCRIYYGDSLVRSFVPVLDANDVPCLYDLLTGSVRTNAGTGTFVAGNPTGSPLIIPKKIARIYVGVNGVARAVKKAYFGESGVARKIDIGYGTLSKMSSVASLSTARACGGGGAIGDYILIAGGSPRITGGSESAVVDTYLTPTMAKGTATNLNNAVYYVANANVGDYLLFGSGNKYTGGASNIMTAYTATLTKSTPTTLSADGMRAGGASVGNYAVFCGKVSNANAYSTTLTRTTPTTISNPAEKYQLAASIGDYAMFAGGYNSGATRGADAISGSLTRTSPTSLTLALSNGASASNSNYAIYWSNSGSIADAYNTSLVKSSIPIPHATTYGAGVSSPNIALFGGGTSARKTVYMIDTNLVRTQAEDLGTGRGMVMGARNGNYIVFAGGASSTSTDAISNVDGYELY